MASTTARPRRKILNSEEIDLRKSASTPRAKAISVAMGIPQPLAPSPLALNPVKVAVGTIMPTRAASAGRDTLRREESSLPDQLPLDLHAHGEEEDRNQPVVHPFPQVLLDGEETQVDDDLDLPELNVELTLRGVDPDQGGSSSGEEEDAAQLRRPSEGFHREKPAAGAGRHRRIKASRTILPPGVQRSK